MTKKKKYFATFTTVFIFNSFGKFHVLPINFPLKLFKNTNRTAAAASSTYNLLFVIAIIIISIQRKAQYLHKPKPFSRRSQWSRGLRRRSASTRLPRLWVRIPPKAWMFVCCECCVSSGRGLCDELITRPEESYRLWFIVVCDLETS